MSKKKSKNLAYRRALFVKNEADQTLEGLLKTALNTFSSVVERTLHIKGRTLMGNHFAVRESGVYLHVTMSEPGSQAATVPDLAETDTDNVAADVQPQNPPIKRQFKDSDIFALIVGDDMVFTSTAMREQKLELYLVRLFEKADMLLDDILFKFNKVLVPNKLQLLQSEGVKSLEFDGCMHYASTLPEIFGIKDNILKNAMKGFSDVIKNTYEDDEDAFDKITSAENMTVRVALGIKKNEGIIRLSAEEFSSIAEALLKEEDSDSNADGGFRIITGKNKIVTAESVTVNKLVRFEEYAKSIHYEDAWHELHLFYNELVENGTVTI